MLGKSQTQGKSPNKKNNGNKQFARSNTSMGERPQFDGGEDEQPDYGRGSTVVVKETPRIKEMENRCELCEAVVGDKNYVGINEVERLNEMIQHVFTSKCQKYSEKSYDKKRQEMYERFLKHHENDNDQMNERIEKLEWAICEAAK